MRHFLNIILLMPTLLQSTRKVNVTSATPGVYFQPKRDTIIKVNVGLAWSRHLQTYNQGSHHSGMKLSLILWLQIFTHSKLSHISLCFSVLNSLVSYCRVAACCLPLLTVVFIADTCSCCTQCVKMFVCMCIKFHVKRKKLKHECDK